MLPVVIGVEDENGDRIDAQRADGTRAPIVLKLSAGMTHSYEFDGGLTRVTVGISASAFYTLKDDGVDVPAEVNLDFINFELTDVPGTDTTEIRHAIDNYVNVTGTVLTIDEASLTSIVLGHVGAPVTVVDSMEFSGDVTIAGDLTVEGATTSIETTVLDIEDRVIHVNHSDGPNDPVPAAMAGLGVHRGAAAGVTRDHAAWIWEEASSWWRAALNTSGDDATVGADLGVRCLSLWLSGTAALTIDKDTAAPVFTQEDVSTGDAQDLTFKAGGTTDDGGGGGHLWLRGGPGGAVSGIGGDVNLVPAGGSVLGATRIWDGAETEVVTIDASTMQLAVDVVFAAAHATPTISHAPNTGTGVVVCEAFTVQSQGATGNAGANAKTGAPAYFAGGDVTGTGSVNTGGEVGIISGSASGGTSNVGARVFVRAGAGTQTNGTLELQDAAENVCLSIAPNGGLTLAGATDIYITPDGGVITAPVTAHAPVVVEQFGGVQTTDATITTAMEFAVADGEVAHFIAEVTMRSATDGDSGSATIRGSVENTSDTVSGMLSDIAFQSAEDATWGTVQGDPVVMDISGTSVRIRVEGGAGDTVNWNVALRVVRSQAT